MLIVTYRDDEVGQAHPLRVALGDLATTATVHRIEVSPLSEFAVNRLTEGTTRNGTNLYHLTGGNPFFVTEVLAAPSGVVPVTVIDAVLARVARLPLEARPVLDLAAVIGGDIETSVLIATAGPVPDEIDECLASGVLVENGDNLRFRHELARSAVLTALSPLRRRLLHARVLDVLRTRDRPETNAAILAHHAEEAGDASAVHEFAAVAARQAQALHAHREATAQFARRLRFAAILTVQDRALLLEDFAAAAQLSLQTTETVAALEEALGIWRNLGNQPRLVATLHDLARAYKWVGRLQEASDLLAEAINLLSASPPSRWLALLSANLVQVHHLAGEPEMARAIGEQGITLAEQYDDLETLADVLVRVGSARLYADDDNGQSQLERGLRLALEAGLVELATQARVHLVGATLTSMRLRQAEQYLADAMDYVTEHQLDDHRWFLLARQTQLKMHRGAWEEASAQATWIANQPQLPPWAKIMALLVLARIQVRRGDAAADATIATAIELVEDVGAIHFWEAIYASRSEQALLAGDLERACAEARLLREVVDRRGNRWARGECAYLQWKAGETAPPGEHIAAPYALEVSGYPRLAATAWREIGCPYQEARALANDDDPDSLFEALTQFERLEARPAIALARVRLRQLGVRDLPPLKRGPRRTTRSNPAGLTQREAEILALLTTGLSNAEMASTLFLTPKTVSHHLSSIYAKLGVANRSEATRVASQLGVSTN